MLYVRRDVIEVKQTFYWRALSRPTTDIGGPFNRGLLLCRFFLRHPTVQSTLSLSTTVNLEEPCPGAEGEGGG